MNAVSLRARLLAGMVGLTAIALVVAALVTYEEQRSFLLDRVGQQVQSALVPLSFQLRIGGLPGDARPLPAALAGRRRFAGGRRGCAPTRTSPRGRSASCWARTGRSCGGGRSATAAVSLRRPSCPPTCR